MKENYTERVAYKLWMACLSASTIIMLWNSLPSAEGYLFFISFSSMLYLTYKDIKKRDE